MGKDDMLPYFSSIVIFRFVRFLLDTVPYHFENFRIITVLADFFQFNLIDEQGFK